MEPGDFVLSVKRATHVEAGTSALSLAMDTSRQVSVEELFKADRERLCDLDNQIAAIRKAMFSDPWCSTHSNCKVMPDGHHCTNNGSVDPVGGFYMHTNDLLVLQMERVAVENRIITARYRQAEDPAGGI